MSLEEQIIEWSALRLSWQRVVLRRVASRETLSDADYDQIVEALLASKEIGNSAFGLEHLPEAQSGDEPVSLVSIAQPEHVNALESHKPLTFEATGLTIIYGDNASGKSGYARLLKLIARARNQEEILSDVFRDTALAKPRAALTVRVGNTEMRHTWPESDPPELRKMLYYDQACGSAYLATESDFPYRPSALFVIDGLIQACVAVRDRIDIKLEANARSAKSLPTIDQALTHTEAAKYLGNLSGSSSINHLDELLSKSDFLVETLYDLKAEEASLSGTDTTHERQKLIRHATKLDSLRKHLDALEGVLGDVAVALLQQERDNVRALDEAAGLLAKTFESEPVSGVGASPWKALWESARRFSQLAAYPDNAFPVVAKEARCVLCQQPLDPETRERLSRFERFVQDDTQTRLNDARTKWNAQVARLNNFPTTPEAVDTHLKDLEPDEPQLMLMARHLLAEYEAARTAVVNSLAEGRELPLSGVNSTECNAQLDGVAAVARTKADALLDPDVIKQRLKTVTIKRKELELLRELDNQKAVVAEEIQRLNEREALEAAKSAAATGPITKKVLELSEENISEVIRDTFTRETDRLHLDRVTIAKTRADRGALLHLPKLVGARQNVTLPRVFSEGERTALGLAAFFTEAHLDDSKSALILDDPVTSFDHIRRGLVAARLAALAETRQVIVFTHDVSLVADLKREAKGLGVTVGERSVTRARGGEKKPGTCSTNHPWKAKDVSERLGELRSELARIKRESSGWNEGTYETEVATWAGNLSETWERIFSQEVVGPVLAEGGLEVRPNMVKLLARFSETDEREFQASYSRVSQWAKRHDKSGITNYVAPEVSTLEDELGRVDQWFKRVRGYKN